MIIFKKARSPTQTLNDLDAYLKAVGTEPIKLLAREVQSWSEFSYDELADLIADGRLDDYLDWQARYAALIAGTLAPLWSDAITAASKAATKGKVVLYDSNDYVRAWIETHGGELITQLSRESQKAVAMVIMLGQSQRMAPRDIAKQVRPLIGLTQNQATANLNYREKVYNHYRENGMSEAKARARADKAAIRYAGKQHRFRAETIVHTELAFAYNRGAHMGVSQGIAEGLMGRCAMKWSTAGTNRVCSRCLALKDTIVGYTDESGVTLPPLHPRCRCAIIYDEVAAPSVKPKPEKPFVFDVQRFGAQSLPEGNYNLTIRRQVQNRHIEGTREFKDYASRLAEKNLLPSKMPQDTDIQSLIKEFHGKGIYTPNPKDDSPREKIDTGRIIGQYWDTDKEQFVDTSWVMIVYSKRGTHIYPIRPQED